MNPKIQKLRNELDKNLDKIRKLEARNAELKQQIRELEDVDIIGMVRAMGLSTEELAKLIRKNPDLITPDKEEFEANE
jgi:cell division protein FtsB